MFGKLIPSDGGDAIQLLKKRLRVGRREGCDIILNYASVSGHHCLMEVIEGYWFIKDLRSRNGVRVEGKKILPGRNKRIDPGAEVEIAKRKFVLEYEPTQIGAYGSPPQDEQLDNLLGDSLSDNL